MELGKARNFRIVLEAVYPMSEKCLWAISLLHNELDYPIDPPLLHLLTVLNFYSEVLLNDPIETHPSISFLS